MNNNKIINSILISIFLFSLFNINANEILNIPNEFIIFAKESSNNEINETNIINHLLYLEMKLTDKNKTAKAYKILGEIIQKIKKEIKNNLTPKEKLINTFYILKNTFNFNYNESSTDLFINNIINKNTKCDTSAFIYLAISQEMNWPISCILLPNHMFIRWNEGTDIINFETTNSGFYQDEFYINEYNITNSNIIKCSEKELIGYFNYKIGNIKFEINEHKEALLYFNNAIELINNCSSFYYNRGIVKNKLKDYSNAIIDFNRAIELHKNNCNIYFGRGNAKYELKDIYGAIDDYDKALELNKNLYEALFNRGMIKNEIKDYYSAIEDFKKIININKNNFKFYNILGDLYYKIKDYYSAIDEYTKAIELNNKFFNGYYNRGIAKKELQNYHDAINDFTKTIDLNNNFAEAYLERGIAYYNLIKTEQAIDDFKKAISIKPDLISNIPLEIKNKLK